MEFKVFRRSSALKEYQLLTSKNLALFKIGSEQITQTRTASLAFHAHEVENGQIRKLVIHAFRDRILTVTVSNGVRLVQLLLDNS